MIKFFNRLQSILKKGNNIDCKKFIINSVSKLCND